MPSWLQTSLPSNWRSQHHNRTAQQMSRSHHPGLGSPCHALYSTTPSWPQTSPPASLRIHPRSCKDLLGAVALSAGHRCDDGCSTMSACFGPNQSRLPPRNCMDQQVREALWVREAESGRAESRVAWAVAWVAVWVAAWEMEWVEPSAWSLAEL